MSKPWPDLVYLKKHWIQNCCAGVYIIVESDPSLRCLVRLRPTSGTILSLISTVTESASSFSFILSKWQALSGLLYSNININNSVQYQYNTVYNN